MTQAEKGETENGKDKEREREQRGGKRPIVPAAVPESLQEVRPRRLLLKARPGRGGVGRGRATGRPPTARALCLQQIQSNFIVVIHPGSTTLRIGRATDTLPVGIPHVIARRHKQQGQAAYRDSWLLRDGLNVSGTAAPRPAERYLQCVFGRAVRVLPGCRDGFDTELLGPPVHKASLRPAV